MARVTFTQNLRQHVACPTQDVSGANVREVLDAVFAASQALRGYVLDDQQALRKHVVVFVDGQQIADRRTLSDLVPDGASVHVMQALSGG